MMNFTIYNPDLVNILILPHSKGGVKSTNQYIENQKYCERLREKDIRLRDNIIIIDGVHTGVGILALESALKNCFPYIKSIKKIALNAVEGISQIPVDIEYILPCEPKFSDTFPRLVQSFRPEFFNDSSKFITEFINLETNPIAQMIMDISKEYPLKPIEESEWFIINNIITPEIEEQKRLNTIEKDEEIQRKKRIIEETQRLIEKEKKLIEEEKRLIEEGGIYKPIILNEPKRYQCPLCKNISGTAAPLNPNNLSLFAHNYQCANRYKKPVE
jgi:hypothetical protein